MTMKTEIQWITAILIGKNGKYICRILQVCDDYHQVFYGLTYLREEYNNIENIIKMAAVQSSELFRKNQFCEHQFIMHSLLYYKI